MRVLLTNDDGIRAPGIVALHRALTDPDRSIADDVVTIAPLTVQSATGHGVTFSEPLMASDVKVNDAMQGVAVDGRPADCVKLALSTLWPERFGPGSLPDVCISGMNAGANCGVNVIYSGTVAAAIESAFLGVPSIAVSLHLGRGRVLWDRAARHARRAIDAVLASGMLSPHTCININVPRCEAPIGDDEASRREMMKERREAGLPTLDSAGMPSEDGDNDEPPIVVCPMNTHGIVDRFEHRESPMGQPYYWSASSGLDFHATDEGTDVERLFARCITVTPLTYDLTDHAMLDAWSKALSPASP
ncbi:MAG: 5'/3'-nucleotidase SurE [Phycisphaerales bacterium]